MTGIVVFLDDVVAPAESIYEGTWGSGAPPPEFVDFEIMHEMHWDFQQLQACPAYVKAYVWELINARRRAEHDANERARSESRRGR